MQWVVKSRSEARKLPASISADPEIGSVGDATRPALFDRSLPRWRRRYVSFIIERLDYAGSNSCDDRQVLAPSNSSTAAAVTFITFVQDLKRKTKTWGPMIELCASGEKTLERFRYQFPDDWLYSDQLRGEWSAYNEILKRKNDSIQEQLGESESSPCFLAILSSGHDSWLAAENCGRRQDCRE